MSLTRQIIIAGALLLGACSSPPTVTENLQPVQLASSSAMPESHDDTASKGDVNSVIGEYCTKCHNFEDYAGGIDLEGLGPANIQIDIETGEKVIKRLRAGMMPPVGEHRPGVETLQALAAALESTIDANSEIKPGRVGLHRLNRTEYGNAIRDLLAFEVDSESFFPADDSSRGFDNQAASLGLSPALLEAYLTAAAKISQLAVGTASAPTQTLYRVAEDANQNFRIGGLPFGTRGGIKFTHNFPVDGDYNFKTFSVTLGNMGNSRPFGNVSGEKLQVLIDGELVKVFDWDDEFRRNNRFFGQNFDDEDDEGQPQDRQTLTTLDVMLPITAGPHEVGITFVATNYAPGLDLNNDFERSTIETGGLPGFTWFPHVGSVRVDGPYNPAGASDTPSRNKLFVCNPANASEEAACAEAIVSNLANLAFRGYSTAEDIETLMEFYNLGRETGDFNSGVEMVLQRVLASPKFIYRIEQEPQGIAVGETYSISDLDLASRLSFFLWSSIPDLELIDLAKAGQLSNPDVIEEQVARMIADPKSSAMTKNFAGQWLALRSLESHSPLVDQFPDFDNLLRDSMRRETELLFDSLIRENRPAMELLTANYTFVNERLAMHYGIPGIRGERFRRVELEGDLAVRAGILGKASTMTVSSQPGRTSPVIRGYWVLANIIGVEPPPPPPNVPIEQPSTGDNAGNAEVPSLREWMEGHRSNPACAGCHRLMDPIGFALETFDAIGRYRTEDNGKKLELAGTLYDGFQVEKTEDLIQFLLRYESSVLRNITQKMLTYALGRGMEYEDMPLVRKVQAEAAEDGFRFQSLIKAIVKSEAFLNNEKTEEDVAFTSEVSDKVLASVRGDL